MTVNSKAQVCYSTNFDLSLPNGPGTNEQQFVMSMHRLLGDRVLFVIPRPSRPLPDDFPTDQCVYYEARKGMMGRFFSALRKRRLLRQVLREQRFDALIFRIGVFPLAEWLSGRGYTGRLFIKTFGPRTVEVFDDKEWFLRILAPINRGLTSALLGRAEKIDVVSPIHQRAVHALYPASESKVMVIDNAVDSRRFTPRDKVECREYVGLDNAVRWVGYAGNLADIRGGTELIRAVARFRDQQQNVHALIVSGDQAGVDVLNGLAQSLQVAERVAIRGPVTLDDIPYYIGAMDVAVSFRDDDGCSELKVRQYISCGRPVVVSANVNRFVEDHDLGSLVDRHDDQAIVDAITHWLDRTADARASSQQADVLHQYAADQLDFDAANQKRLAAWRLQ